MSRSRPASARGSGTATATATATAPTARNTSALGTGSSAARPSSARASTSSSRPRLKPEWNGRIVDDSEYVLDDEAMLEKMLQTMPREELEHRIGVIQSQQRDYMERLRDRNLPSQYRTKIERALKEYRTELRALQRALAKHPPPVPPSRKSVPVRTPRSEVESMSKVVETSVPAFSSEDERRLRMLRQELAEKTRARNEFLAMRGIDFRDDQTNASIDQAQARMNSHPDVATSAWGANGGIEGQRLIHENARAIDQAEDEIYARQRIQSLTRSPTAQTSPTGTSASAFSGADVVDPSPMGNALHRANPAFSYSMPAALPPPQQAHPAPQRSLLDSSMTSDVYITRGTSNIPQAAAAAEPGQSSHPIMGSHIYNPQKPKEDDADATFAEVTKLVRDIGSQIATLEARTKAQVEPLARSVAALEVAVPAALKTLSEQLTALAGHAKALTIENDELRARITQLEATSASNFAMFATQLSDLERFVRSNPATARQPPASPAKAVVKSSEQGSLQSTANVPRTGSEYAQAQPQQQLPQQSGSKQQQQKPLQAQTTGSPSISGESKPATVPELTLPQYSRHPAATSRTEPREDAQNQVQDADAIDVRKSQVQLQLERQQRQGLRMPDLPSDKRTGQPFTADESPTLASQQNTRSLATTSSTQAKILGRSFEHRYTPRTRQDDEDSIPETERKQGEATGKGDVAVDAMHGLPRADAPRAPIFATISDPEELQTSSGLEYNPPNYDEALDQSQDTGGAPLKRPTKAEAVAAAVAASSAAAAQQPTTARRTTTAKLKETSKPLPPRVPVTSASRPMTLAKSQQGSSTLETSSRPGSSSGRPGLSSGSLRSTSPSVLIKEATSTQSRPSSRSSTPEVSRPAPTTQPQGKPSPQKPKVVPLTTQTPRVHPVSSQTGSFKAFTDDDAPFEAVAGSGSSESKHAVEEDAELGDTASLNELSLQELLGYAAKLGISPEVLEGLPSGGALHQSTHQHPSRGHMQVKPLERSNSLVSDFAYSDDGAYSISDVYGSEDSQAKRFDPPASLMVAQRLGETGPVSSTNADRTIQPENSEQSGQPRVATVNDGERRVPGGASWTIRMHRNVRVE